VEIAEKPFQDPLDKLECQFRVLGAHPFPNVADRVSRTAQRMRPIARGRRDQVELLQDDQIREDIRTGRKPGRLQGVGSQSFQDASSIKDRRLGSPRPPHAVQMVEILAQIEPVGRILQHVRSHALAQVEIGGL